MFSPPHSKRIKLHRIFYYLYHSWSVSPLSDGSATCTQATGGASLYSSEETSSTGMTGRPLRHRSSLSVVCGTCSGTRGAVSLFLTQIRLLAQAQAQAPTPNLPQFLLPPLPQLEPAEQDPHLSPNPSHSLPHAADSACPMP